jgi:hypothetical protein
MRENGRTRLIALSGAAWAVLAVVGVIVGNGEAPEPKDTPAKIVSYYSSHSSDIKASAVFFSVAFLFFLLFCGTLRSYLRRNPGNEGLATLMLIAAGVLTAVAGIGGGIELGIAKNIHHLSPDAAQAANLIEQEVFLPALVAGFIFSVCSGIAILRSSLLPRWLGWIAIVMAVVFVVPPAGFIGLIVLVFWSLAVSVVMYMRYDRAGVDGTVTPALA